eukprot:6492772-Amphidinium_carterae.6
MPLGWKRCKTCAVHRPRGQQCCYCRGWVCSRCQIEQNTLNGVDVCCSHCSVIAVDSDESQPVVSVSDDESLPERLGAASDFPSGAARHEAAAVTSSGPAGSSTDLEPGLSSTDVGTVHTPGLSSTDVGTVQHTRRRWKRGVLGTLGPIVPEPPVKPRRPRWKSGVLKLEKGRGTVADILIFAHALKS